MHASDTDAPERWSGTGKTPVPLCFPRPARIAILIIIAGSTRGFWPAEINSAAQPLLLDPSLVPGIIVMNTAVRPLGLIVLACASVLLGEIRAQDKADFSRWEKA